MTDENTPTDTYIDEGEERARQIDAELERLRKEIHDDDDAAEVRDCGVSLAEQQAKEMKNVVETLKEQQSFESVKESSSSAKKEEQSRSPLLMVAVIVPIILAYFLGQSQSPPSDVVGDGQVSCEVPSEGAASNDGAPQYSQSRKKERCKYDRYGNKYCESVEESVSSDGGKSQSGGPGLQAATFRKCWFTNGESYCESVEKSISGGGSNSQEGSVAVQQTAFTRRQLMDEFMFADTNGDGMVSYSEFERYKRNYLQVNPDADPQSFANFDEYDANSDGYISVQEHEGYYIDRGLL